MTPETGPLSREPIPQISAIVEHAQPERAVYEKGILTYQGKKYSIKWEKKPDADDQKIANLINALLESPTFLKQFEGSFKELKIKATWEGGRVPEGNTPFLVKTEITKEGGESVETTHSITENAKVIWQQVFTLKAEAAPAESPVPQAGGVQGTPVDTQAPSLTAKQEKEINHTNFVATSALRDAAAASSPDAASAAPSLEGRAEQIEVKPDKRLRIELNKEIVGTKFTDFRTLAGSVFKENYIITDAHDKTYIGDRPIITISRRDGTLVSLAEMRVAVTRKLTELEKELDNAVLKGDTATTQTKREEIQDAKKLSGILDDASVYRSSGAKVAAGVAMGVAIVFFGAIPAAMLAVKHAHHKYKVHKFTTSGTSNSKIRNALTELRKSLEPHTSGANSFQAVYMQQCKNLTSEQKKELDAVLRSNNKIIKMAFQKAKAKTGLARASQQLAGASRYYRTSWVAKQLGTTEKRETIDTEGMEDTVRFIVEKGLFKNVSRKTLHAMGSINYISETDKRNMISAMFRQKSDPISMQVTINELVKGGRKDLALQLISERWDKLKDVPDRQIGQKKLISDEKMMTIHLAAKLGNNDLLQKIYGIDFSKIDLKNEEDVKKAVEALKEHVVPVVWLGEKSITWQTLLHFAAQSDNPGFTEIAARAVKEKRIEVAANFNQLITDIKQGKKKELSDEDGLVISNFVSLFPDMAKSTNIYKAVKAIPSPQDKEDAQSVKKAKDNLFACLKKIPTSKTINIAVQSHKNPYLVRDKSGRKPIEGMSMSLANQLDDLNGLDGNQKGSFTNSVAYLAVRYRMPPTVLEGKGGYLGFSVAGKFGGALASTALMGALPIDGMQDGMLKTAAEEAAINVPMFGGAGLGFAFKHGLYQTLKNKWDVWSRGLSLSLDQHPTLRKTEVSIESPKPHTDYKTGIGGLAQAMKDRNPGAIKYKINALKAVSPPPKISERQANELINILRDSAPHFKNENDREELLRYMMNVCTTKDQFEKIFETEMKRGGKGIETAKKLIREFVNGEIPAFPTSAGKENPEENCYKACIIAAVKMGDVNLFQELLPDTPRHVVYNEDHKQMRNCEQVAKDRQVMAQAIDPKELWLGLQDRKATETLEHMAMASGNPHMLIEVAKQLNAAAPTDADYTMFRLKSKQWGGLKRGKSVMDTMSREFANQMDEMLRLDPSQVGSLTDKLNSREFSHSLDLLAEGELILPFKMALNVAVKTAVLSAISTATLAGSAVGGPVGGLLAGAAAEMGTGLAVMAGGFAGGIITGKGAAAVTKKALEVFTGDDATVGQLGASKAAVAETLEQTKKDLLAHEDQYNELGKELIVGLVFDSLQQILIDQDELEINPEDKRELIKEFNAVFDGSKTMSQNVKKMARVLNNHYGAAMTEEVAKGIQKAVTSPDSDFYQKLAEGIKRIREAPPQPQPQPQPEPTT